MLCSGSFKTSRPRQTQQDAAYASSLELTALILYLQDTNSRYSGTTSRDKTQRSPSHRSTLPTLGISQTGDDRHLGRRARELLSEDFKSWEPKLPSTHKLRMTCTAALCPQAHPVEFDSRNWTRSMKRNPTQIAPSILKLLFVSHTSHRNQDFGAAFSPSPTNCICYAVFLWLALLSLPLIFGPAGSVDQISLSTPHCRFRRAPRARSRLNA